MPRFKSKRAAAALALAVAAGVLPALAQEKPESLLPPGFNEQLPQPAPAPAPSAPVPSLPPPGATAGGDFAADNSSASDEVAPAADPAALAAYELPGYARRSLDQIGIAGPENDGFGPDIFRGTPGRWLIRAMDLADAPVASRWVSIGLRRALVSRVDTPSDVDGATFAAARGWLLVRMGEAQPARALVQAVDTENYTPALMRVALQAALASGDPGTVCPVAVRARELLSDRGWPLIEAICASLSGVAGAGRGEMDAARRSGVARGIDLLLADKIVGTVGKRRAVTIEWTGVDRLTAWRYGLAAASATEVPDALFATVNPRVQFWRATAPAFSPTSRAHPAELAAAQGVFSSAALVDLYGEIAALDEGGTPEAGIARDLRAAYAESERTARLSALRTLWNEPRGPRARYARLILTARAAAALPPARGEDTDLLIASMLSAGLDLIAPRWAGVVDRGSEGWALLALGDPAPRRFSAGDVGAYSPKQGDAAAKRRMFVAGLAGLERLDAAAATAAATATGFDLTASDGWTQAIDRAATRGAPGTVLLLAAMGMQTPSWHGVPPHYLYHIVAALHRVGLDPYARMVAAEALTRL